MKKLLLILAVAVGAVGGANAQQSVTQTAPMQPFLPAGAAGGGVLEPGTFFPPTSGGSATLTRGSECVAYTISTTGLPAGGYTNWWVVFNNPSACSFPEPMLGMQCGVPDLFAAETQAATFLATGDLVGDSGVALFTDRHCVGDSLGMLGSQNAFGTPYGILDPQGAEF